MKQPYNPQGATAARPQNVKLELEKKALEQEKVSLMKMAKDNATRAKKEAELREKASQQIAETEAKMRELKIE